MDFIQLERELEKIINSEAFKKEPDIIKHNTRQILERLRTGFISKKRVIQVTQVSEKDNYDLPLGRKPNITSGSPKYIIGITPMIIEALENSGFTIIMSCVPTTINTENITFNVVAIFEEKKHGSKHLKRKNRKFGARHYGNHANHIIYT